MIHALLPSCLLPSADLRDISSAYRTCKTNISHSENNHEREQFNNVERNPELCIGFLSIHELKTYGKKRVAIHMQICVQLFRNMLLQLCWVYLLQALNSNHVKDLVIGLRWRWHGFMD